MRNLTDERIREQAQAICADVACGASVVEACKKRGRVSRSTFMLWVQEDRLGVQSLYRAATKERSHAFAEEMIEIADSVQGKSADEIRAADLRISVRKWNAARMEPLVYGDRVRTEVTGAEGGPVRLTTAQELTDDQLAAIAAGSGGGTAGQA